VTKKLGSLGTRLIFSTTITPTMQPLHPISWSSQHRWWGLVLAEMCPDLVGAHTPATWPASTKV